MDSPELNGRSTSSSVYKKYQVPASRLSVFLEKLNALRCFVARVRTPEEQTAYVEALVPEFYVDNIPEYANECAGE